jgi:hypothetical protein
MLMAMRSAFEASPVLVSLDVAYVFKTVTQPLPGVQK